MSEPLKPVELRSILEDNFPESPFVEQPIIVNAVIPERTFGIKKLFDLRNNLFTFVHS